MDALRNTAAPGFGPSSADPTGSSKLGKDEFVKLLMTQLSNQDPTSPQDSEAFVAQLAQFANVELQTTANANLEAILVAQAANNQVTTAGLVGNEVVYQSDNVYIDANTSPTLSTKLHGNAERMVVNLTDESGNTHSRTVEGPFQAGNIDLDVHEVFSGIDFPASNYKVSVAAQDKSGNSVDVDTRIRAKITGVTFENGYAELLVGNLRIGLNDVMEILSPEAPVYTSDDRQDAVDPNDGVNLATEPTRMSTEDILSLLQRDRFTAPSGARSDSSSNAASLLQSLSKNGS